MHQHHHCQHHGIISKTIVVKILVMITIELCRVVRQECLAEYHKEALPVG